MTLKNQKPELKIDPPQSEGETVRSDNQTPQRIISIDPGIRTFGTGYTPDGYVYHIGKDHISRLSRLLHYKYRLQSLVKTHPRGNKNKIRKAFKRLCRRIRNLVDDFHKKTVHWLYENFNIIIVPQLDTLGLCRTKLSKKVKNKIQVWSHGRFIQRMKMKHREYPSTHLIIPSEEYTSKTCSSCGQLHQKLGQNKTYQCPNPSCQKVFDRDVNGAFNILLKTMTDLIDPYPNAVHAQILSNIDDV